MSRASSSGSHSSGTQDYTVDYIRHQLDRLKDSVRRLKAAIGSPRSAGVVHHQNATILMSRLDNIIRMGNYLRGTVALDGRMVIRPDKIHGYYTDFEQKRSDLDAWFNYRVTESAMQMQQILLAHVRHLQAAMRAVQAKIDDAMRSDQLAQQARRARGSGRSGR